MTDYEFYQRLFSNKPCSGCPAYEYLGHCGHVADCIVFETEHFIHEVLNWDKEYFINYIYFQDYLAPEYMQIEDEFWKDEFENYLLNQASF